MVSSTARNSLVVVAVVAAGAALFWLRGILAPLALAIFLLVMMDGLARAVKRYANFIPDRASMPTAIILVTLAFIGSVYIVVDGARGFGDQLGGISARVNHISRDVATLLHLQVAPTVDQMMAQLDPRKLAGPVLGGAQGVFSNAFFVLIYLGFLLASRHGFKKKIVALFPTRDTRQEAAHIFEGVRNGIESYVWVQTVTGAMIAGACWLAMAALGLHNAPFWAFVIFISSYVPLAGAMLAGLGPPLFALVQFQTYWQAIVLAAVIQIVLFVVGNIVLPRMQAKNSNIDPVVVLLSLAFWGAMWGVTGAFLSTPLTVIAMAILAEFPGSRWVAVLLSENGAPYPMDDEDDHTPPAPPAGKSAKQRASERKAVG